MAKKNKIKDILEEKFQKDREKMWKIINEHKQEHDDEITKLVDGKEKNLGFVSNENDEYETKILSVKETISQELEKIE